METTDDMYIKPTKEHPVFVAQNMYSGNIIENAYREWEVKNEKRWMTGITTALNLTEAICATHKFMKDGREYIGGNTKFEISMIDGSVDECGDPIRVKCYSISMKQAKKFRIF